MPAEHSIGRDEGPAPDLGPLMAAARSLRASIELLDAVRQEVGMACHRMEIQDSWLRAVHGNRWWTRLEEEALLAEVARR